MGWSREWTIMNRRMIVFMAVFLVLLLTGLHFMRFLVLGNVSVPVFNEMPVAQAISSALISTSSPVKDFDVVKEVRLNNDWLVVWIKATGNGSDVGVLVLKAQNVGYAVVLGPGNQFSSSSIRHLPASLEYYLYTLNLVQPGGSGN